MKFYIFLYLFDFSNFLFKGHIVLFSNFAAKRAKNNTKNQKNISSKCVLDLNFSPIKESVFLIF
jgi:hypothetical protein